MNRLIKKIYLNSPFALKKTFANLEAIRRNFYRRRGNYKKYYHSINVERIMEKSFDKDDQVQKINKLLLYAKHNIPYYEKELKISYIENIQDIKKIPISNKLQMSKDIKEFINQKHIKKLWNGSSSGSTGTPFSYYRDRRSMQFEYALYDKLYNYLSKSSNSIKGRISGVNIVKAETNHPPFWYFIKKFNQLQLSSYHINLESYKCYVDALNKYKVELGTGYASSWLFLSQYILKNKTINKVIPTLSAIVTDSEGFSYEDKLKVEKAFSCPVYQTYGLGEVGILAVQCQEGHYHTLNRCYIEIVNEKGEVVEAGTEGEIVVTDFYSFKAPFIRYRTGDNGILGNKTCKCGWKTPYIESLVGRTDDYVITNDGKKIGRLSHIAKPIEGALGVQIIQERAGSLNIKILPSEQFNSDSMKDALNIAKDYLGDMDITWEIVQELEKTNQGKVRYVIRRF